MKKKLISLIVVSIMLVLPLMSNMAYADSTSSSTTAKIAFTDGDLEFDDGELDTGMYNMDIDFGSHQLPTGLTRYEADDGNHTLRILDARTNAGGWEVTVQMGMFVNADVSTNSFAGIIKLSGASVSSTSNSPSGLNPVSLVTIDSTATSAASVVVAAAGLKHGTFDTTWLKASTELYIDNDAAAVIEVDHDYVATLIWTLISA